MPKYDRRFTPEEFKLELFKHLHDMPQDHFRGRKKLEQHTAIKAQHYSRALDALDAAVERVKKLAASHPDSEAQAEAKAAVTDIESAINAYGEASMSGNSSWNNNADHDAS